MSKVNEEFLDNQLDKVYEAGFKQSRLLLEGKGANTITSDALYKSKKAILQHFQQEQESKTSKRLVEWTKHLKKGEELFGHVDWDAALYELERRDKWSAGEESKMYTQSEVHRLIREAVEKELKKLLIYAKNIPDVGIRYPEDKEKYREFARASVVMTNYASIRLEALSNSPKEQLDSNKSG